MLILDSTVGKDIGGSGGRKALATQTCVRKSVRAREFFGVVDPGGKPLPFDVQSALIRKMMDSHPPRTETSNTTALDHSGHLGGGQMTRFGKTVALLRAVIAGVVFAAFSTVMVVAPGVGSAQDDKHFYAVGTFTTGTQPYIYAAALAGLLRQSTDEIALNIEATSGTAENLDLLHRGEIQLATVSPERLYAAFHGEGSFEGRQVKAYILWQFLTSAVLLFTDIDSPIKSISDLSGKRVVIGPAGSSSEIKNTAILKAHGYTRKEGTKSEFEELTTVLLPLAEAAQALAQGSVDAVLNIQQVPDAFFSQLTMARPMRIVGVDPEMFDEVKAVYPAIWPTTVSANTYTGQTEDIVTLGDPSYMVATDAVSEEDAYTLTKLYYEEILPKLAQTVSFVNTYVQNPELNTSGFVVPAHPGAMRYYKEKGIDIEVEEIK